MAGQPYLTTQHRPCSLYRIYVLDPRTNYKTITLGYIGETARMPFTRFMEHLYEQPFGDTIVGHPQVDPRVFADKTSVVAAEEAAVKAEKPLYNIEFNGGNPDRIKPWEAIEQRRRREAARGNPNWRPAKGDSVRVAAPAERGGLSWLRWVAWIGAVALGWPPMYVAASGQVDGFADGRTPMLVGAVAATLPFMVVRLETWRRQTRSRRTRRRK